MWVCCMVLMILNACFHFHPLWWKIMPLIGGQMYHFGNWFKILIIIMMLYNLSWHMDHHSRHLNREIIDVIVQSCNRMGSWQTLQSETTRVGRDPLRGSLHTHMSLPFLNSSPISPTSSPSPQAMGAVGIQKRKGHMRMPGTDSDSFWGAFAKLTPSASIGEKHLGSQWSGNGMGSD